METRHALTPLKRSNIIRLIQKKNKDPFKKAQVNPSISWKDTFFKNGNKKVTMDNSNISKNVTNKPNEDKVNLKKKHVTKPKSKTALRTGLQGTPRKGPYRNTSSEEEDLSMPLHLKKSTETWNYLLVFLEQLQTRAKFSG